MTRPYAWSHLFQAVLELASRDAPLAVRVQCAYRHLACLNSTNLPKESFARLQVIRERFARTLPASDDEDGTITLRALSSSDAELLAGEIIGLYDEVLSPTVT